MTAEFDAAAYLTRIRWSAGPVAVTLPHLRALLHAHMLAFPFENLDVLLGRPPRLDLASLQAKMVAGGRGGYCFEQARLFGTALAHFGFDVRHHLARVVLVLPRHEAPRTHHFLVVTLPEGEFVLDPGFGGLAPRVPVPLHSGAWADIGDEAHTLSREGPHWTLQARVGGAETDLWVSPLDEALPVDFELGNHYTATHPASQFVNRLGLRALLPGGRISVLNREVTWRRGGQVKRWPLADRGELAALLAEHFGIHLPEVLTMRVPAVPEWT
jgi:N-hydroxyarylamine O-acetyltransferase